MNKRNQTISRRKLLKGMGIGAGALALAACAVPQATQAPAQPTAAPASGEPTAAPAPTTAPASSGPVEIIYWGFSGGLGKVEEQLINMWNEKQSEVKVTPQVQGNYEETAQKLTAALAAQQGPDMVLLSDVWWFKFYRAKALMPLNDLLKEQQIDTTDFVESLWNEGVRKGCNIGSRSRAARRSSITTPTCWRPPACPCAGQRPGTRCVNGRPSWSRRRAIP